MKLPNADNIEASVSAIPEMAGAARTDNGKSLCFIRGKQLHAIEITGGEAKVLDPADAARRFHDLCRSEVRNRSTADMRLFNIVRDSDGSYVIDFPDKAISVSAEDYASLRSGVALPDSHPFSQAMKLDSGKAHVVYSNALMHKASEESRAADDFAFAVQRAYPQERVYRDPLSDRTAQLVGMLNSHIVKKMESVSAVIAGKSFKGVEDGKVIANLRQELVQAGVHVVEFNQAGDAHWGGGEGQTMIVITGHSNSELGDFVKALGDAGYLEGNYVVFNSCETPLTRSLVDLINSRYKAVGTFTYEGKISAANVENMLAEVVGRLQKYCNDVLSKAGAPKFVDVLRDAVLKFKLNGVWVICHADFEEGGETHA